MSAQGSNTHGPQLDDQLKDGAQPVVQGHGPAHVQEARQGAPYPDDTDSSEAVDASGVYGRLQEAPDDVTESIGSDESAGSAGSAGSDESEEQS